MRILAQLIGPLIEAWGEVKVQKARVILSLVGVVAAVAAMSTVIALGDLMVQSIRESQEAYSGRAVTMRVNVQKSNDEGDSPSEEGGGGGVMIAANGMMIEIGAIETTTEESSDAEAGLPPELTGVVNDPIGAAMESVATRFKIPFWSRHLINEVEIQEYIQAQTSGFYRGRAVELPPWGMSRSVTVKAVDPAYQVLFRLNILTGRWLSAQDIEPRVTPVVINEIMWKHMGRPNLDDPMVVYSNDETPMAFRVVGVVKSLSQWDSPEVYVLYDAWKLIRSDANATPEMLVWVGHDQFTQARRAVPQAVTAVLGEGWTAQASGGEGFDGGVDQLAGPRSVIMAIGGIVIFLGALGLLNVAIVTVKQRMREIGIRRAMGASAMRIFFAVFMESVVATFVAGVLGVGISVVVLRYLPLESFDIVLQDAVAFPMSAAIAGVGISVSIGALCGIIPAVAAVRVKPIDAIRS